MSNSATKNLVIVESPAKAKTIEKFLGPSYTVTSCYGHIRDLSKGDGAIDIENGFSPNYEIDPDKLALVRQLRKLSKEAETVWLASDEDREGEAISWHLFETLGLDNKKTKRIAFHEITKTAILKAIETPRTIDYNLVNAQQARRVLDRLVGFELSPILWRKVRPSLSAGRVQSVATRIIVDREREILSFNSSPFFQLKADFTTEISGKTYSLTAKSVKNYENKSKVLELLETFKTDEFSVIDLEVKPVKRHPSAPFTTSTLQQEASRKLGFSITQTMRVAQNLYESGYITYMRTDSVNLSELAIQSAKNTIINDYGIKYSNPKRYTTKSDSAQEAHEAIRPTDFNRKTLNSDSYENKLYELIWKRAISSQMSAADIERTIITVKHNNAEDLLQTTGEIIKFDGFLRVYLESEDEELSDTDNEDEGKLLPPVSIGLPLNKKIIVAQEKFTRSPARYTEASLVKKLETLGIGRPSTYAPTISTIQKRGYVVKESREGVKREFLTISLIESTISEKINIEITGKENNKLFPTEIGLLVNDFLVDHFPDILDYNFTAKVENEFDEIAKGQVQWNKMIGDFYFPFHKNVVETTQTAERLRSHRLLGNDPKSGKPVYVRLGKFGPLAQIGEDDDVEKRYAALRPGMYIESVSLNEALTVFDLPRILGLYEDNEVKVSIGRFGPYAVHKSTFYSLAKTDDPYTIELNRAIELIEIGRKKQAEKTLKTFDNNPDLLILKGRWGAYISYKKENFKLPKDTVIEELTEESCMSIVTQSLNAAPTKAKKVVSKEKKETKTKTSTKKVATKVAKKKEQVEAKPRFSVRKKQKE